MELFEEIRREHAHGAGTIRAVAKKLGVHRRMVRHALASSIPLERKLAARNKPSLGPVMEFIDEILREDQMAPRKQRHTAHRIWERIRQERSDTVAEATVRRYVREGKQKLGLFSQGISAKTGDEGNGERDGLDDDPCSALNVFSVVAGQRTWGRAVLPRV